MHWIFDKLFGRDKLPQPKYQTHVVSRDTWMSVMNGDTFEGRRVVEGFHDREGHVPILVTAAIDTSLCPHKQGWGDCPDCRH